jgi:iron complex transport system ATP-binding protein
MERMSALEARGVSVRRGGRQVLRDVSMRARVGEVTALVGPNGAGKSTLLTVLAGQLAASSGEVLWMGRALPSAAQLAEERAVVEQRGESAFGWTVAELVALGRLPHRADRCEARRDEEAVWRALEAVGLVEEADRPLNLLSGGQQQRAHIARALAQLDSFKGRALLLDEPTASLDWSNAGHIYKMTRAIATRGLAVLIVLHDLQAAAQIADHVVMMVDGQVMEAGPPSHVLNPERVSRAFGGKIKLSGALVPDFLA